MKIKEALEDGTLSLEDDIDYADMTEEEYKQEIERLNNIIKEVREYIEENTRTGGINKDKKYFKLPSQSIDILEILDKADKGE